MKYADKMFYRGFAAALGHVSRWVGGPRLAAKIAFENGIKLASLRASDTDHYDLSQFEAELEKLETPPRKRKK